MEGKGIFYYNDGARYEGDWKNGLREGKGIFYYKNGNKYEGDWKNGLREGKGIYYYKNGNKYEGYWKDNKMRHGSTNFLSVENFLIILHFIFIIKNEN